MMACASRAVRCRRKSQILRSKLRLWPLFLVLLSCGSEARTTPVSAPTAIPARGERETLAVAVTRAADDLQKSGSSFVNEPELELVEPKTASAPLLLRYRLGKVHIK